MDGKQFPLCQQKVKRRMTGRWEWTPRPFKSCVGIILCRNGLLACSWPFLNHLKVICLSWWGGWWWWCIVEKRTIHLKSVKTTLYLKLPASKLLLAFTHSFFFSYHSSCIATSLYNNCNKGHSSSLYINHFFHRGYINSNSDIFKYKFLQTIYLLKKWAFSPLTLPWGLKEKRQNEIMDTGLALTSNIIS